MKMTIVLDTDDPVGLEDASKIVALLRKKHSKRDMFAGSRASFGKIALIKFVRAYGRECDEQLANSADKGEEPRFSGLKECKGFVDAHWKRLIEEP